MSTQKLHNDPTGDEHVHRIGSVSRLAGVPVSTLRMWESRHAAFVPGKTGGLHRLYTDADVVRARLLRQLTDSGQSIGRIATLPAGQLQQMLAHVRTASPESHAQRASHLRLTVVGEALAARLHSPGWRQRLGGTVLDMRAVFGALDDARADAARVALRESDVFVARINAVQPSTVEALLQMKSQGDVRNGMLLYNFGSQAGIATLRDAGFLVRREPIDDAELAELLRSVTWAAARSDPAADSRPAAIPAPRYTDADLARIAAEPSRMLCECPRHLADIITQLASFEEYSTECLNDSAEDAQVHAQLRSVAGSARALFEGAMAMVLEHEARKQEIGHAPK